MIIFNGTEAIEIASHSNIRDVFIKEFIESSKLPFVELKRGNDGSIECEIGYIGKDGVVDNDSDTDVQIGHVQISWIRIKQEIHKENEWLTGDYYVDYHYTIVIYIDRNYQNRYEFYSTDSVTYENGKITNKSNHSIISFFTYIVPLINEKIDSGIPVSDLNMEYFYQKYADGGKEYASYETNPYKMSLEHALDLIYSLQVKIENRKPYTYSDDDVTGCVLFEGKKGVIYNVYIEKLFSSIISASLSKQRGSNEIAVYHGSIYKLPNYLKYDAESLRRYILRKLYIGVLLNYDQEKAEEGFCHSEWIRDCKEIEQNSSVRSILNFILGIRATCFEDGESRVGRDDSEWTEYTVLFPTEYGFKPSSYLLELINNTLDVKLELQEENLCYYHRYTTKAEYIAGAARRRDCGSFEMQRDNLHRLLKKIVPMMAVGEDLNKLIG